MPLTTYTQAELDALLATRDVQITQLTSSIAAHSAQILALTNAIPASSPTPTPTPAPPPAGTGPYGLSMNAADYGPNKALTQTRTPYVGPTTIPAGGYTNLTFTGSFTISANSTFRNCVFKPKATGANLIQGSGITSNVVFEDCLFDGQLNGQPGVYDAVNIWATGFVFRRCEVRYCANGLEFAQGLVEWCYFHHIWQEPGTQEHADAIQADAGGPITVQNNYIAMGRPPAGTWSQTSAIGMWADLGNLRNVLVTHNVTEPFGGFQFYCGTVQGGYSASNVVFKENVVKKAGALNSDYGNFYSGSAPSQGTQMGNVYDDGTRID